MVTRPPPADEYIRKAYNLLRKANWIGALDDALTHPLRGKIILAYARQLETGGPTPTHAKPPNDAPVRTFYRTPAFTGLDRKRLASGERDDD